VEHSHLFMPFTAGEYLKLLKLVILGNPNFKGDYRGAGFDINKLESSGEGGEASTCLAIFPVHDEAALRELEVLYQKSLRFVYLSWDRSRCAPPSCGNRSACCS
jgi:hypothetical protein